MSNNFDLEQDDNYKLFCSSILSGDYENSVTYLYNLYEIVFSVEIIRELNLYAFLLGFVTPLPNSLISYADMNDLPQTEESEEIVMLIKNKRFHQALFKLKDIYQINKENESIKICMVLVENIASRISKVRDIVKTSVLNNELERAKNVLEQNEDIIYSNMKVHLYLINIILKNEVPQIKEGENSYNFIAAIKNNDFETARKFHLMFLGDKIRNDDITCILLDRVIDMMRVKKQDNSSNEEIKANTPLRRKELLRQKRVEEARQETIRSEQALVKKESEIDILTILTKLMNDNNLFAITLLKNYLKELGKEEYEFLIIDLIKISYLEKDYAFLNQ